MESEWLTPDEIEAITLKLDLSYSGIINFTLRLPQRHTLFLRGVAHDVPTYSATLYRGKQEKSGNLL